MKTRYAIAVYPKGLMKEAFITNHIYQTRGEAEDALEKLPMVSGTMYEIKTLYVK